MDDQSKNVTEFLEVLQDLQNKSLGKLHLAFLERGAQGIERFITLSSRPCHIYNHYKEEFSGCIIFGLQVKLYEKESLEVSTEVWWSDEEWRIETEVTRYFDERDGIDVIRKLPIQRTNKLKDCINAIQSDMLELTKWSDLTDIGPSH